MNHRLSHNIGYCFVIKQNNDNITQNCIFDYMQNICKKTIMHIITLTHQLTFGFCLTRPIFPELLQVNWSPQGSIFDLLPVISW